MPRVDAHFERIARRLGTLQLLAHDAAHTDDAGGLFVGSYTAQGMRTVLDEYGLTKKLEKIGLGGAELVMSEEDPFRHRLELVLEGGVRVMDLRLHLTSCALKGTDETASVVVVEWLLMQNPRARFTVERPRLPGQQHPGTGLGRDVAQLLVLMCRRIGRDGLLVVPEHFHLAELYAAAGWLAPSPTADRDLDDVKAGCKRLTFAQRAWAVERGFVIDEDGAPFAYRPEERALPVSERMKKALSPGGFLWLARLIEPRRSFAVDVAGLARSLTADPVEGMDPADLVR